MVDEVLVDLTIEIGNDFRTMVEIRINANNEIVFEDPSFKVQTPTYYDILRFSIRYV